MYYQNKNVDETLLAFARKLSQLWMQNADDMFINENGKRDFSMTFDREEVFSITCDWFCGFDTTQDERILWDCMTDEDREVLKMQAFPDEIYGY